MNINFPLVSIITISYNSEETIEKAINSVLNQTYKNIEYIIIDGKSKDKTLEIIQKYKSQISKIISEKDDGIYNEGVVDFKEHELLNKLNLVYVMPLPVSFA